MKAISILAYGADPTAQRPATSAIQQAIKVLNRTMSSLFRKAVF